MPFGSVKDALLQRKTCPFTSLFVTVWILEGYKVVKRSFSFVYYFFVFLFL